MKKRHFVLVENDNYCDYPTLIRIKEYSKSCTKGNKTSNQLVDELTKKGYIKLESNTNIILTNIGT
jgi:hypothetical protein